LPDAGVGRLSIYDGSFEIVADLGGAAIGAGAGVSGSANVDELEVLGGTFNLEAPGGAGVGAGFAVMAADVGGNASVRALRIVGGTFVITGKAGSGAGIGGGDAGSRGTAKVGSLVISGGDISVKGASPTGVGAGYLGLGAFDAGVESLVIEGGNIEVDGAETAVGNAGSLRFDGETGINCQAGVGKCVTGDVIEINGSILGITATQTFFISGGTGLDSQTGSRYSITPGESADLDIRYRAASEPETLPLPTLHFARIGGLSAEDVSELTFSKAGYQRSIQYNPKEEVGLLVSLPEAGAYLVAFKGQDGVNGSFCNGTDTEFDVGSGETFLSRVAVCGYLWPTEAQTPSATILPPPTASEPASQSPAPTATGLPPPTRSEVSQSLTMSPTSSPSNSDGGSSTGLIIGLSVGGGVLLIVLIVVVIVVYRRRTGRRLPDSLFGSLITVNQPERADRT
jgi:hypothetical protein